MSGRGRLLLAAALLAVAVPVMASSANHPVLAANAARPGVLAYGDASAPGDPGSLSLNRPIVGMAATPDGGGYWLVASDGGIFSFGSAKFFGSAGGTPLNRPIVGMAAAPDGRGYWLVASDGGIFSYGSARFFGSTGSMALNRPIVGMAPALGGGGYWLVASDGGIFSYGSARFFGSTGSMALNRPIVGMAAAPDGQGYWLVASDGGIFSYGSSKFFGSTGSMKLNRPIVGMAGAVDGAGYWLLGSDGGIFSYGSSRFFGSAAGSAMGPGRVAAAMVRSPSGQGYDILAVPSALRVGFAGDVHGVGRVGAYLANGGNPLAPMASAFAANNVNVVNLETAVGSRGTAQDKQFTFHSPPSLLTAIRNSGVQVVNLANNHTLDFGAEGLLETIDNVHAAGLQVIGAGQDAAHAYAPVIVSTPGGTVAIIGLSQVVPAGWAAGAGRPGVASAYDLSASTNAVRSARSMADHVVVMIHWGVEQTACPTGLQVSTGAKLLDAGADAVVGGHPHELQGVTLRNGRLVGYSMGNFVWYANTPPNDQTGLLSVSLDAGGVAGYELTPARVDDNGRPVPLSGQAAADAVRSFDSLSPGAGRC
jgi:poly-gamma-glutamate capsule biosynthesis protein CapA/YwtB (metallophosphatase superfamily)